MLPLLTCLFFILGYTLVSAQDYLVTIKGDTLRGKVRYFNNSASKNASTSTKYVRLTSPDGKKSNHPLLQTRSFRMDDEVYHTVRQGNSYTFMKLITSGYLSLYRYQLENKTTWDGVYMAKKGGEGLDIPNIGYKKRVTQFLADCPDVVNKVLEGELERTELVKLVEEYNLCIDIKTNEKFAKVPLSNAWKDLETAVKQQPEFDKKNDALEMIREIQRKVSNNETVPSFLINGLKESLKDQAVVTEKLAQALQTLN